MKKLPWIIGAIFLITLSSYCYHDSNNPKKKAPPKGVFKDMVNATFVGSDECRKCHERLYSNWKGTLHSRMMVDVKKTLRQYSAISMRLPLRNRSRKTDIAYTVGSQWRQRYLTKSGDDYLILPAQFSVADSKWEETGDNSKWKNRSWFKECAGCHATG